MLLKYIGLAPITNKFGDWVNGDVKNVPDDTKLIGFEVVEINKPKKTKKRRYIKENYPNKMETDNINILEKGE